jgi:hypothetical protein
MAALRTPEERRGRAGPVAARGADARHRPSLRPSLCPSRPRVRASTRRSNHHFGAIIFAALVAGRLLAEVPATHAEAEAAHAAEAGRPGSPARPESMWSILSRHVVGESPR